MKTAFPSQTRRPSEARLELFQVRETSCPLYSRLRQGGALFYFVMAVLCGASVLSIASFKLAHAEGGFITVPVGVEIIDDARNHDAVVGRQVFGSFLAGESLTNNGCMIASFGGGQWGSDTCFI